MTQEERDEKIKKLREKYHQTKENTDATKLKREREKARLAAMTQEERNEKIESVVNDIIRKKQVNLILLF